MVERLYLKENLSFSLVDLSFEKGLILFTGPSGAGKSVLLNSILSTLGLSESRAKMAELVFSNSIDLEPYGLESDDVTVFKQMKREKLRFFINSQTVSKKVVSEIGKQYIKHLTPRDSEELKVEYLLHLIDSRSDSIGELKSKYSELYSSYQHLQKQLRLINSEIEDIESREEFIRFEIDKIDTLSPKNGEDEELYRVRKRLSKKDKIENHLSEVSGIFEQEASLREIFSLMGLQESENRILDFFETLRVELAEVEEELSELDSFDIEGLLNRIEKLSELKDKYGSIEEAILYRDSKERELQNFYRLREEREVLKRDLEALREQAISLAENISRERESQLTGFQEALNSYLSLLNLQSCSVKLTRVEMDRYGVDSVELSLGGSSLKNISYGEQNRLRLSLLTLHSKSNPVAGGVLFLDEIDANLSGDESMRVASVLKELSKSYQIFAISHQPQLTSRADQHFLVYREESGSYVKELDSLSSRADEIVRMVGGKSDDSSIREFAKRLLEERD
jgi:DNA repair protein RecN (Recombination protein N)